MLIFTHTRKHAHIEKFRGSEMLGLYPQAVLVSTQRVAVSSEAVMSLLSILF